MTDPEATTPSYDREVRLKANITPMSAENITVSEMRDGRLAAMQKVDHVNIGELDALIMNPGQKAPQEIAFRIGPEEHRLISKYGRANTAEDLLRKAHEASMRIIEKVPSGDTEEFPWLHVVFKDGKQVGMEIVGPSLLKDFNLIEGQPMAAGQEPVRDLHVIFYEGERAAKIVL